MTWIYGTDWNNGTGIEGTYENSRMGVFGIVGLMEWNIRDKVINGIDATHCTNKTYGAKRICEVDYPSVVLLDSL